MRSRQRRASNRSETRRASQQPRPESVSQAQYNDASWLYESSHRVQLGAWVRNVVERVKRYNCIDRLVWKRKIFEGPRIKFQCKLSAANFDRSRGDIRARCHQPPFLGVFHKMSVSCANVENLTHAPQFEKSHYVSEDLASSLAPAFKIVVVEVVLCKYIFHGRFGQPWGHEKDSAPIALPHSEEVPVNEPA